MGRLKRLLLLVFVFASVLGIGYLILEWLAPEPLVGTLAWLDAQPWLFVAELVLLGIAAIGVLVVLLRALFTPSRSSQLVIEDGASGVSIAKDAIASTARYAIEAAGSLEPERIRVRITGKRHPKVSVVARVNPGSRVALAPLGEEIASSIASSIETLTGYPVEKARVSFVRPTGRAQTLASSESLIEPSENEDSTQPHMIVSAR